MLGLPIMGGKTCPCPHHKMVPLCVFAIGLVFFLNTLGILSAYETAVIWPLLLMVIGGTKLMGGMCKCCGDHRA